MTDPRTPILYRQLNRATWSDNIVQWLTIPYVIYIMSNDLEDTGHILLLLLYVVVVLLSTIYLAMRVNKANKSSWGPYALLEEFRPRPSFRYISDIIVTLLFFLIYYLLESEPDSTSLVQKISTASTYLWLKSMGMTALITALTWMAHRYRYQTLKNNLHL